MPESPVNWGHEPLNVTTATSLLNETAYEANGQGLKYPILWISESENVNRCVMWCCSYSLTGKSKIQCRTARTVCNATVCLLSIVKYFKLFPFTLIISHPPLSQTPFMRNKTKFEWKYRRQWHRVTWDWGATQEFKSWHQNLWDVKIAKRSLIPVPAQLCFFPTIFV